MNQAPEVIALAKPFMNILSWSIIPMIIFLTLKQFTDGLEFTKTAMLLSILAIPINAIIKHLTGIPSLQAILPGNVAVILVIISVVLTLICGLIPSRSAAKKDPVEALRTE